jgi:hypothetical protein
VQSNRLSRLSLYLANCLPNWFAPRYSFKRLFLLSCHNSKTMRYVGGGLLKNPVTRANQSREGGRRIEPGGRVKTYKSVLLVTAWLHTTDSIVKVSVLLFQYGKGLLCSNIHHQRGCRRGLKLWITLKLFMILKSHGNG